jgi:hypothetical protein
MCSHIAGDRADLANRGMSNWLTVKPHCLVAVVVAAVIPLVGCVVAQRKSMPSAGVPVAGPVAGDSGRYRLTVPAHGWTQLSCGILAKNTDIELRGPSANTFVLVYARQDRQTTLDQTVAQRFARIFENSPPGDKTFSERRYFLDEIHLVAASLARYQAPSTSGRNIYLVLTVRSEEGVIEALGHVGGSSEDDLRQVLTSLELVASREPGR